MALIKCEGCQPHAYQDKTYGDKVRVANRRQKDGKFLGYRCTICCATHQKALSE